MATSACRRALRRVVEDCEEVGRPIRAEGPAGMLDRSSRPHHQANRTPASVVRKIVHLRWKQRLGPVEIADRLGMQSSTVYAVLRRCRLNRLTHIDRATGEPIRRYEHERPGDLIHVDVKKLGRVPHGGGWRYTGREQGWCNRAATAARTGAANSKYSKPLIGTCYLHTAIDDHSRVAYVEARDDETKETTAEVLRNAVAWFAERGVTVQRVLSDNGGAYRSYLWRDTCAELASRRNAPGPTGRRPTARSRGSIGLWSMAGRSRSSTTSSPPGWRLCQHGSTCDAQSRRDPAVGAASLLYVCHVQTSPSRGWCTLRAPLGVQANSGNE